MSRCPSDLALEAYLLDPEGSGLAPHLEACDPCRSRIARMEAEGDEFRRFVFPATVEAVQDAADPAGTWRRRLKAWLAPIGGLVAAAAAVMLVLNAGGPGAGTTGAGGGEGGPPPDYVGFKGDPMGLAVFVGDAGGARAVPDGGTVEAGAAIRFKVRPAPGCRLWIVSVDQAGQVSRLFPAAGEAAPLDEPSTLPGGAVLDGTAGPERIYAVCAPAGLTLDAVEKAARGAAGGGAEKVRAARALTGLPAGTSQATLLLEKRT